MIPRTCQYGNHVVSAAELYCYRDPDNGLTEDVEICWRCLLAYCEEHYPGGNNVTQLRRYWKAEIEPRGQLGLPI